MRVVAAVALLFSCHKDKDGSDTGKTDGDTDTDTDADADVDTDADVDHHDGAELRLANASEGLGKLDIYIDGNAKPARTDVETLTIGPFAHLDAGVRTMTAITAGANPKDGKDLEITLDDGKRYITGVFGTPDDVHFVGTEEDPSLLTSQQVGFWIVHAAIGAPDLDVYDLGVDPPVEAAPDLKYGHQVPYAAHAGEVTLGIDLDQDGTPDLTYDIPSAGNKVVVPLFVTYQGKTLVLLGASPGGTDLLVLPNEGLAETGTTGDTGADTTGSTADTGTSASTADTGGGASTGDTGSGPGDTSDTGT